MPTTNRLMSASRAYASVVASGRVDAPPQSQVRLDETPPTPTAPRRNAGLLRVRRPISSARSLRCSPNIAPAAPSRPPNTSGHEALNGKAVDWMEQVSDEEYAAAPRRVG